MILYNENNNVNSSMRQSTQPEQAITNSEIRRSMSTPPLRAYTASLRSKHQQLDQSVSGTQDQFELIAPH